MKHYLLPIFGLMLISSVSHAQYGSGAGYIGNFKSAPIGIQFFTIRDENVGFYFDFKMSSTEDDSGVSKTTADVVFGDELRETKETSLVINCGATKKISSGVLAVAYLGLNNTDRNYRYYDATGILGDNGRYWVIEDAGNEVNFGGGFVFVPDIEKSNFYFTLTIDKSPSGVSAGLGFLF